MTWNNAITPMLWIPPVILIAAGYAVVWFLLAFRASLRGRGKVPAPVLMLVMTMITLQHAGYMLAPVVWGTPNRWWAVGLLTPAALLTLGAIWLTPIARTCMKIGIGKSARVHLLCVGVVVMPPVLYGVPRLVVLTLDRV